MSALLSAQFDDLLARIESDGDAAVAWHAGLRYSSHYQPIYSLSHGRVVGHEALLRAHDAEGRPVPPPRVFDVGGSFPELLVRDRLARLLHVSNHQRVAPDDLWLFVNVHPQVFAHGFGAPGGTDGFLQRQFEHFKLAPHRVVIEVIEDPIGEGPEFDTAVQRARAAGCLIAIDDFGAGHSNFDRVWRLQPEIVKLDRGLVVRAATDPAVRRIAVQMVSLLHECGALVLMEGVETPAEALVALEADADMVQGYLFGRPQAQLAPSGHSPAPLLDVWDGAEARWHDDKRSYRDRIGPFHNAMGYASVLLHAGRSIDEACHSFLGLANAEVCYLLGPDGRQIGDNRWSPAVGRELSRGFEPLRDVAGARWARRPYFRRAIDAIGRVQVTRPYRTLHGGHLCVTVSAAFLAPMPNGETQTRVICGDVRWG
jgi:EAL domain-containing protein (putative c-di-GMP-specific phosphodiesterase class I)